jgi:hypothetical protein
MHYEGAETWYFVLWLMPLGMPFTILIPMHLGKVKERNSTIYGKLNKKNYHVTTGQSEDDTH